MAMNESLTGRLLAAGMMTLLVHASQAAVTTEEAKQLGSSLTEFGSEKAGNADGSIPAYTGGPRKSFRLRPQDLDPLCRSIQGRKALVFRHR